MEDRDFEGPRRIGHPSRNTGVVLSGFGRVITGLVFDVMKRTLGIQMDGSLALVLQHVRVRRRAELMVGEGAPQADQPDPKRAEHRPKEAF